MTTYSAVVTTGIYCRPGCRAKPRAENVRTFELAAAAEAAGYRACLRCRPYRVAGPVGSDTPELVCRAVQLVIDGILDDGVETDLAGRLGVSARQLRRMFHDHLGVTPDQLARSRRAHFARRLLDDSELTVADVAFASGFGSLRQFNRAMLEVFRASPSELRGRRRRTDRLAADGGLTLRLPFARPYDWDGTLDFLAARAVPGVESVRDGTYRRTISLDGEAGALEVGPGDEEHLLLRAHLPYWEGLIHIVERVGRMVGTDADVRPALAHLSGDPAIGRLVRARPGLRVPGAWGPFEVAVHAVVTQHCGLVEAAARMGELVRDQGISVPGLGHGLTHLFPAAEVLAGADDDLPPGVRGLAAAVAAGEVVLDGGQDLTDFVLAVSALPGIEVDTAHRIALRLGHRDAFPAPDLRSSLGPVAELASRWRPWRALAATHLMQAEGRLVTGAGSVNGRTSPCR